MNIFMMHVGNFVGMRKFCFMYTAKFCRHVYEQILWIWKDFNGHEILAMKKNFVMFIYRKFCGYAFGYVGIYLCMGMNMWENSFFFNDYFGYVGKEILIVHGYGKKLVVVHGYVKKFVCGKILVGY